MGEGLPTDCPLPGGRQRQASAWWQEEPWGNKQAALTVTRPPASCQGLPMPGSIQKQGAKQPTRAAQDAHLWDHSRLEKAERDLEGQTEPPALTVSYPILASQPLSAVLCSTIRTDGRRRRGFAEPQFRSAPLTPDPFPAEHAGLASPRSPCASSQAQGQADSRNRHSQTVGFSATRA